MKEYVLGFVYVGPDKILLQRKNRGGEYLEGKLNGLGGKIELNERPKAAMQREYLEETGDSRTIKWKSAGKLTDEKTYLVHVFFANVVSYFYDNVVFTSEDENAEELFIINKNEINWDESVDNLKMIFDNISKIK